MPTFLMVLPKLEFFAIKIVLSCKIIMLTGNMTSKWSVLHQNISLSSSGE
jgi:hypothetical protein